MRIKQLIALMVIKVILFLALLAFKDALNPVVALLLCNFLIGIFAITYIYIVREL